MKVHKVEATQMAAAKNFAKRNGFWNPAMTPVNPMCGVIDPIRVAADWDVVDCKRCLKKRKNK